MQFAIISCYSAICYNISCYNTLVIISVTAQLVLFPVTTQFAVISCCSELNIISCYNSIFYNILLQCDLLYSTAVMPLSILYYALAMGVVPLQYLEYPCVDVTVTIRTASRREVFNVWIALDCCILVWNTLSYECPLL